MIFQRLLSFQAIITTIFMLSTLHGLSAAEFAFRFTGQVLYVGEDEPGVPATPFGYTVPPFSFVSGGFVYESNVSDSHAIVGCDCTGYRHRQINGFRTEFVTFGIQADEYVVEVRNNVELIGYMDSMDTISWVYPGIMGPDLDKPLLAGGIPYESGFLRVDLIAPNSLFSDSSLPSELNLSSFAAQISFNLFGDETPPGEPDVLFMMQSLEEVTHLESDHDLDGDVDGRDFLIWQRYFGINSNNGDANSDLIVDGLDLEIWQTQYGSTLIALSTGIALPEPSNVVGVWGLIFLVSICRVSRNG